MPSRKGTSRRKRDALTPHYCEIPGCHYSKIFQRHRIVPGRENGKYVLGNVIALCPNHHGEADRGWIPSEELLQIVRERIERNGIQANSERGTSEGTGNPAVAGHRPAEEPAARTGDSPADAADGEPSGVAGI